jgi:hypothetical protein
VIGSCGVRSAATVSSSGTCDGKVTDVTPCGRGGDRGFGA